MALGEDILSSSLKINKNKSGFIVAENRNAIIEGILTEVNNAN